MRSPGVGVLRALRAMILASAVVGITVGAHVLAGGHAPEGAPLIVLTGLTAVVCHIVSARRVSWFGLVAVLGLGQFGLHHAFEFCAGLSETAASHAHHHADDGTMFAMHVIATLLVAALLTWGERSIWRLWSWLSLKRLPDAFAIRPPRRPNPVQVPYLLPAPEPGSDAVMGRAPPVLSRIR